MAYPAQKIGFQEYVNSVTEGNERVKRLEKEILYHTKQWRLQKKGVKYHIDVLF